MQIRGKLHYFSRLLRQFGVLDPICEQFIQVSHQQLLRVVGTLKVQARWILTVYPGKGHAEHTFRGNFSHLIRSHLIIILSIALYKEIHLGLIVIVSDNDHGFKRNHLHITLHANIDYDSDPLLCLILFA